MPLSVLDLVAAVVQVQLDLAESNMMEAFKFCEVCINNNHWAS